MTSLRYFSQIVLVDPDKTLEEAEVENGAGLTALVLQPQLAATEKAFALWCHGDSAIVTWGLAAQGGDSEGGSVATCGDSGSGGDSSGACRRFRPHVPHLLRFCQMDLSLPGVLQDVAVTIRDQLKGVQQIQASYGAFAAILSGGSVITWGGALFGGDSSAVRDQLIGVQQIQATSQAFAAILKDQLERPDLWR